MKKKRIAALTLAVAITAAGCAQSSSEETTVSLTETSVAVTETAAEATPAETTTEAPETTAAPEEGFIETGKDILFSEKSGFYTGSFVLRLKLKGEGKLYYTTDNTTPTEGSVLYNGGISIPASTGDYPKSVCVRAVGYLEDGTVTDEIAATFMVGPDVFERFSTDVFCISGDPADFTGKDGIFTNPKERGKESERRIFVTAFDKDGNVLIEQFAGARVYGGASRTSPLKSLKLFARKSYDADHGSFKYNFFDTIGADGDFINKYDKLVLRNTGNDMQFAYIRDEYLQVVARAAGYSTYEGVIPALGYFNGSYYCLYWLHENYCNKYFEEKFGKGEGRYVILEGTDKNKSTDDEDDKFAVDEFREIYEKASQSDLTIEENYNYLKEKIDVNDYLDYFAFNIYIGNSDWPNNNFKCYRYYPAEGENLNGRMDGRWRFLLHDTDYSLGLYEQRETRANYDTLKGVMKEGGKRYSPLFASLMKRDDCREYFISRMLDLMNTVFVPQTALELLEGVTDQRDTEMPYYYKYLEKLRNAGDRDVWSRADHLKNYMNLITFFLTSRQDYMIGFLEKDLDCEIEGGPGTYAVVDEKESKTMEEESK